ncbi:hypothetical protein SADUNF_Sadunf17G0076200 [Salix dunnii]|uniref:Uncharacterized protein n=1 Tax=Salix dunnii TaxID=1413687 RepID=A0A835J5Y6_9ROSI|nr:hypothetical protein SADUNF_Sadunf17G0076200 [Salix dunnii]
MANTERKKPGEEERKIQVLTVLRNGAILKNIFVTIEKASHYPIPPSNQLKTISQKLFATDLSSVYGTWIPRKKIPGLRVESSMKMIVEADENSMATKRESVEKKGSLEVAGKGDEKYQDVGSLYCDEICESIAKKEISSAALVPDESMDSFQSPEYFSFQQELPETDSKGSSLIRESNAEFFSKRTPLSTASPWDIPGLRVEVNEVDTVKVGGSARLQAALGSFEPRI